jgi:hypothetical protein
VVPLAEVLTMDLLDKHGESDRYTVSQSTLHTYLREIDRRVSTIRAADRGGAE